MRYFLLLLLTLNSYAFEWNQEKFDESMKGYSEFIDDIIDDPSTIKDKTMNKYSEHIKDMKKIGKKGEEYTKETYFVLEKIVYRGSKYFYIRSSYQFMDYLINDSLSLFYFLDNASYNVPLVAPLRREFDSRYDAIKNRTMFLKPYIRNSIRQQLR
jgi:hypothetical protein